MTELRLFSKFGRALLTSLAMAVLVTGLTATLRNKKVQEVAVNAKDAVEVRALQAVSLSSF
jgi:hypothetical protein